MRTQKAMRKQMKDMVVCKCLLSELNNNSNNNNNNNIITMTSTTNPAWIYWHVRSYNTAEQYSRQIRPEDVVCPLNHHYAIKSTSRLSSQAAKLPGMEN